MKRILSTALAALLLLASGTACAQRARSNAAYNRKASALVTKYKSALSQAAQKAADLQAEPDSQDLSPYIYRLVGPGVYYSSAVKAAFRLADSRPQGSGAATSEGIDRRDRLNEGIDDLLLATYMYSPEAFHYYDTQIDLENTVSQNASVGAKTEDLDNIYNKVNEIKDVADIVDNVDVDIQIEKPNFWATKGKFLLQFTQNYFSENWYKGGNNNVTLLSNLVLEANYNDQKRVTWDNKLDMRLGFITATSDSIHRYLTNNDKIYLFSKVGIKAAKSWFYALSLEANSQFMPGYRSNDRSAYSNFLAPLDVYLSLGMDWKPTLKNGNSFSLALLPFSYKMRYITEDEETIHKSYNMVDKDFQQDFGSKIEFNSSVKVADNLVWRCRCYFFTSYEYVEAEMENNLSFQFNKYISSEVNALWRFDDNRGRNFYDSTLGYFQFKEYFTLGLSYNF